jgi:hypothetical protein
MVTNVARAESGGFAFVFREVSDETPLPSLGKTIDTGWIRRLLDAAPIPRNLPSQRHERRRLYGMIALLFGITAFGVIAMWLGYLPISNWLRFGCLVAGIILLGAGIWFFLFRAKPDTTFGKHSTILTGLPGSAIWESGDTILSEVFSVDYDAVSPVDAEEICASISTETEGLKINLTAGLCALIIRYLDDETVIRNYILEQMPGEGTTQYMLEEYLYLEFFARGEAAGQKILKDLLSLPQLQQMAKELGVECWDSGRPDQIIEGVLRALGFKVLGVPIGIEQSIVTLRKFRDQCKAGRTKDDIELIGLRVGKELEKVLRDLIHFYSWFLWGEFYEQKLISLGFLGRLEGGRYLSLDKCTLGKFMDILLRINAEIRGDPELKEKLKDQFDRSQIFPSTLFTTNDEAARTLGSLNRFRAFFVHENHDFQRSGIGQVRQILNDFIDRSLELFGKLQDYKVCPAVISYHALHKNLHGELFFECVGERGEHIYIRTDEKIQPGRHYFCYASGNPMAIHPLLILKR